MIVTIDAFAVEIEITILLLHLPVQYFKRAMFSTQFRSVLTSLTERIKRRLRITPSNSLPLDFILRPFSVFPEGCAIHRACQSLTRVVALNGAEHAYLTVELHGETSTKTYKPVLRSTSGALVTG